MNNLRNELSERTLFGLISDADTATGMLLAGIGQVDAHQRRNWFVVEENASVEAIEAAFLEISSRTDIAILLISQHIADRIRVTLDAYDKLLPTILEIPSKDSPYVAEKDSLLKRIQMLSSSD